MALPGTLIFPSLNASIHFQVERASIHFQVERDCRRISMLNMANQLLFNGIGFIPCTSLFSKPFFLALPVLPGRV
jgi:hypothetical protein